MSPLDPHMIKRQQNTDKAHTQKIQHNSIKSSNTFLLKERSGSVVECLNRDRRAAGSSLTGVTALCP